MNDTKKLLKLTSFGNSNSGGGNLEKSGRTHFAALAVLMRTSVRGNWYDPPSIIGRGKQRTSFTPWKGPLRLVVWLVGAPHLMKICPHTAWPPVWGSAHHCPKKHLLRIEGFAMQIDRYIFFRCFFLVITNPVSIWCPSHVVCSSKKIIFLRNDFARLRWYNGFWPLCNFISSTIGHHTAQKNAPKTHLIKLMLLLDLVNLSYTQ